MYPSPLIGSNIDLGEYIDGYLTYKYKLDTSTPERPVMNVDDNLPCDPSSLGLRHLGIPRRTTTIAACPLNTSTRIHRDQACGIGIQVNRQKKAEIALHRLGG